MEAETITIGNQTYPLAPLSQDELDSFNSRFSKILQEFPEECREMIERERGALLNGLRFSKHVRGIRDAAQKE